MIFNTTSAEVLDHALDRSTHQALLRQLLYALMGLGLAGGAWWVGYRRLLQWSPFLLGLFTFLLILVLIPGVGREVNGSRRWLSLAGFSFQPSEFVKLIVPAFLTYRLTQVRGETLDLRAFLKLIGIVTLPILLILVEPNNGTAGVIGLTVLVMCVMTRIRFKYWALPLLILVPPAVIRMRLEGMKRLLAFGNLC